MAAIAPPIGKPGFDLYANQQGRIRSSSIAFIVLPTIFVILRLVSRKVSHAGYWWDDLLIFLALLLSYGLPILNLISLNPGLGKHIYILAPDATELFLHRLWMFEIFFGLTTCCNKLSVLAFYRRIFPIAQLRIVLLMMTAIVLCWALTFIMVVVFQCVPIRAFWELQYRLTARCVNPNLLLLVPGCINCVLDVLIVIIPLPLLWRLRTTRKQKITLTSIFVVGGFVCVCSVIRLVVLSRLQDVDLTWNYINAAIWTATEPSMGVVSACLPSLRPLFNRIFNGTYHGPTFKSTRGKSAQNYGSGTSGKYIWSDSKDSTVDSRSFSRLEDGANETKDNNSWGFNVHVHGGRNTDGSPSDQVSLNEMQTPARGIRVKTEVTLISTQRLEYRDQLF